MAVADGYEYRELSDGRWGVFVDGLCIHVARSHEEAIEWRVKAHCRYKMSREGQDRHLGRNVEKLK